MSSNKIIPPLIQNFVKTLPECEFSFAYGSAVQPQ
jgi:hypothetical protein